MDVLQPVVAVLVFASFIYVIRDKKARWIVFPLCFSMIILIICVSSDGLFKHYLGGFWYTDPSRLGAQIMIFALPVLAYLLSTLVAVFCDCLSHVKLSHKKVIFNFSAAIFFLCLVGLNWNTSFAYPLRLSDSPPASVINSNISTYNDPNAELVLSSREKEFVSSFRNDLDNSSVILNVPDDGSSLLYGIYDMNIYYRRNYVGTATDLTFDELLRCSLANYQQIPQLKEGLKEMGAKYVLILDEDCSTGCFHTFKLDDWKGFYDINENTNGFKLVSKEGDCALYEIVY